MTANLCGNSASTGVTHYTVLGSEDRFPNEMGEKKKKRPQAEKWKPVLYLLRALNTTP